MLLLSKCYQDLFSIHILAKTTRCVNSSGYLVWMWKRFTSLRETTAAVFRLKGLKHWIISSKWCNRDIQYSSRSSETFRISNLGRTVSYYGVGPSIKVTSSKSGFWIFLTGLVILKSLIWFLKCIQSDNCLLYCITFVVVFHTYQVFRTFIVNSKDGYIFFVYQDGLHSLSYSWL